MNKLITMAVAGTLLGVSVASFAAVRAAHVRSGNWELSGGSVVLAWVPLNAAGATTISFNLPGPGVKVLTYSAECAVAAPEGNTRAYLDLDIVVNDVVVPPTGRSYDAFCSSNGTVVIDGWTHPSITVAIPGKAGVNTVKILARRNSAATGIRLGDSSLVIHD
ncbi:MAG TPA: hypothetical protein VM553_04140 [Dongiaceae bacterium]|nr:hypothetical protein [Dongiaceae bacterium]